MMGKIPGSWTPRHRFQWWRQPGLFIDGLPGQPIWWGPTSRHWMWATLRAVGIHPMTMWHRGWDSTCTIYTGMQWGTRTHSTCNTQIQTQMGMPTITPGTEKPTSHPPTGRIWTADQPTLFETQPPTLDDPTTRQNELTWGSSHSGQCRLNNIQTQPRHQQVHACNEPLWQEMSQQDLIKDWVWFQSHWRPTWTY